MPLGVAALRLSSRRSAALESPLGVAAAQLRGFLVPALRLKPRLPLLTHYVGRKGH